MRLGDRVAAPLTALLVTGCAGGPGVEGVDADRLFRSYSGVWTLDTETSDPLGAVGDEAVRDAPRGPASDPFGGGFPAAGGRRGNPGGAFGGRGRGGMVDDPGAIRATLALARMRPERLRIELDDSTFATSDARGRRTAVPTDGEEVELVGEPAPVRAKVRWDDRVPTLEREVEGGGRIADRFELVEPDRLVVTRRVQPRRGRSIELRSVYVRASGSERRPPR
jgi:hypothetical protein